MGKDKKETKTGFFVMFIYNVNTIWGIRKENGSIFSSQFLWKSSPPHWIYNQVSYIKSSYVFRTIPFSSQYCFSCFHKVLVYRHHMNYLLSNVHHAATHILLSNFQFHHVATQILVTAPNLWHFLLLYYYMSSILRQVLCVWRYVIVIIIWCG